MPARLVRETSLPDQLDRVCQTSLTDWTIRNGEAGESAAIDREYPHVDNSL